MKYNNLFKNIIREKKTKIKKYEIINNTIIYEDIDGNKFVAKKSKDNSIFNTYNYLNSRGFNYLPRIIYNDKNCYIYKYEEELDVPVEEKISDIIKIISLLHNKTVYYIDNTLDDIKIQFEDIKKRIDEVSNYYDNLITVIEGKSFQSPSEYMLLRNCSSIFSCINFCHQTLDRWYEFVKEKNKKRVVMLHNNLDIDHFIKGNTNLLIGWDCAKRDIPIYDFIKLYKNNYNKFNFSELYKEYNKIFPLLDEEKMLLFILLFIPQKVKFNEKELLNTKNISNLCNYLYITDNLFMENNTEYSEK